MTLTPTQRRILQAMRDGADVFSLKGTYNHRPTTWHAYGLEERRAFVKLNTRTPERLIELGMIEPLGSPTLTVARFSRQDYTLTPAGAAALEEQG